LSESKSLHMALGPVGDYPLKSSLSGAESDASEALIGGFSDTPLAWTHRSAGGVRGTRRRHRPQVSTRAEGRDIGRLGTPCLRSGGQYPVRGWLPWGPRSRKARMDPGSPDAKASIRRDLESNSSLPCRHTLAQTVVTCHESGDGTVHPDNCCRVRRLGRAHRVIADAAEIFDYSGLIRMLRQ
jgi:hypothetical protein